MFDVAIVEVFRGAVSTVRDGAGFLRYLNGREIVQRSIRCANDNLAGGRRVTQRFDFLTRFESPHT